MIQQEETDLESIILNNPKGYIFLKKGRQVKLENKEEVKQRVLILKEKSIGRPYADSHSIYEAGTNEKPEETFERIISYAKDLPGKMNYYLDIKTKTYFAYAKYNTF